MHSQEDDFTSSAEDAPFCVVKGWQQTSEARGYVNTLLKRHKRRHFGLLERPHLLEQHRSLPLLFRRLFLVGKSGVGKTSTVSKLCGREVPLNHEETLGIQTSTIYWPAKLLAPKKVVLLELELWDTGERAMNKFDHILPACKQSTDGAIFFFSFTDRYSWEELPHLIARTLGPHSDVLKLVVGTHADSTTREVTQAELDHFQKSTRLIVLPIANTTGPRVLSGNGKGELDGRAGIAAVTPFLNTLVEVLLAHEQQRSKGEGLEGILGGLSPETESPSQ